MPAVNSLCGAAAGKNFLSCKIACLHRVTFKKRDGHKGNVRQLFYVNGVNTQCIAPFAVERIIGILVLKKRQRLGSDICLTRENIVNIKMRWWQLMVCFI